MLRSVLLALLTACASAPVRAEAPLEPGEVLLDHGGDLTLEGRPAASVKIDKGRLVAWAQTEVPGASRLQAALAMVDGLVRAELLKALSVHVTAADTAVIEGEKQSASSAAAEVAKGVLPKLPLARHAWLKVRRDGKEILRLYARIDVERGVVASALADALSKSKDAAGLAQRALERMERAP